MNATSLTTAVHTAISKILTPLVKILLRNGVSFEVFHEISKRIYFDVAMKDFAIPGKKQTNTRISTITGFSRKEVLRLRKLPPLNMQSSTERFHRAARVINAWVEDAAFHNKRGQPAALPFEGEHKSFMTLVKRSSGDITARTILDELVHNETVTFLKDGRIRLMTQAYIPKGSDLDKIRILGTDVSDQINTINHNLTCAEDQRWYQRKVCYDNVPLEMVTKLREKSSQKAQAALISINRDLAKGDRDNNPRLTGEGKYRVGISIYYFQEKIE
jgi:DnaJ-domain-containing protein 1